MKLHGQASPVDGTQRTAQTDKFSCKLCGEKFPKKALLTLHEEHRHDMIKTKTSNNRKNRVPISNGKPAQVFKKKTSFSSIFFFAPNVRHSNLIISRRSLHPV